MGDVISLKDYREQRRARTADQTSPQPTRNACAPKGEGNLEREQRGEKAKEPADDKPSA